jgi:hypothetical protein
MPLINILRRLHKQGENMWGILVVGNINELDLYRGVAALVIAWKKGIRTNVVIGREQSLDVTGKFKFDNILYELERIPIDVKTLVKGKIPKAIAEDSTDLERLQRRYKEIENTLSSFNINCYYIHVRYLPNENIVINLMPIKYNSKWYVLGVGLQ